MTALSRLFILLIFVVSLGLLPVSAHAYLDPGTGSYILQIVIGSLLAVAFTIKAFWHRIRAFLENLVSSKRKGE
jgi:hypothetical protein